MIPTEKECYALMEQYQMLDTIREHSMVVAKIVRIISSALVHTGALISIEKAVTGALLHDIGKTSCLKTGGDHAALGKEICLTHRFDAIAEIVGQHVWLKDYSPEEEYSEREIVYYADKRVLHSSVVDLDVRLHDILHRYGRNNNSLRQRIRQNFGVCRHVEEKLFKVLNFKPEDVAELCRQTELPSQSF
jgi:putative nucleotidyltransferase with HDIG domain